MKYFLFVLLQLLVFYLAYRQGQANMEINLKIHELTDCIMQQDLIIEELEDKINTLIGVDK